MKRLPNWQIGFDPNKDRTYAKRGEAERAQRRSMAIVQAGNSSQFSRDFIHFA